uniref:Uncharacterized protein LOC105852126 n=1 Tax=Cicer arietinum TaxID=3827 RepID=A0A1S3E757_CICAR|nr:uncharacterized protein LOC105852126 [Cicer arietinum]
MARIKMTVKRKKSCQEPEENQDVYSSTESDCREENQSEATSMNTISSSQPSKSSSPFITPKIVKKSSSSTPSRRSSRIMSGAVSTSKAPPQDNTVHVINSDDSKTTPLDEPAQQTPLAKSNSKTSTPKRAKPSSSKPHSSSTKISANTSLFDSDELETVYTSKWQNKSVVNGKIIDLADIKQGGFNIEEMFEQLGACLRHGIHSVSSLGPLCSKTPSSNLQNRWWPLTSSPCVVSFIISVSTPSLPGLAVLRKSQNLIS